MSASKPSVLYFWHHTYLLFIIYRDEYIARYQCNEQQSPSDFALAKEIKISCNIIPMCFASVTQRGKYETILSLMNKDHMIREAISKN